ncbi:PsbP-related protein [Clostridium hydrogenum]|uniref:PsbP-related protein n=1 Tax=Clostridium hydrogenum TaxID=2855764 RepID=UPI001F1DA565|nr:hypothetical protein [Clostridium hydrogenum]
MKFVVIDGKKLGAIIVVVGLTLVLFGIGTNLGGRIRSTAYIQSNLGQLKKYNIDNLNISYMLPIKWTTNTEKFSGNEIIYHNNFNDNKSIHGFVQVWNKNQDLLKFLNASKEISEKQNTIQNYSIQKIKVKDKEGYNVQYTIENENGQKFNADEYFIDIGDKFVRFSFYVNSKDYKADMKPIFKAIVETLKV